ncbi:hypothetical protein ACFV0T_22390 [Streptomyces sp. NPDC059582]|uniref:hypothetical protein n=1 Tax=Streptomyces sp. NPDC059582 TaxID=3346875 RepID=UPI0036C10B26
MRPSRRAARPDATPVFADNVIAVPRGRPPQEYRHKNLGAVGRLGLHEGVTILFTEAVTSSHNRT